jgi:hypothetical protein
MENLLLFLATTFVLRLSSSRRFKNEFIEKTGCSVLQIAPWNQFESSRTPSGDELYFNECVEDKVTYGIICIQLNQPYIIEVAETLLSHYIGKLRKPFKIKHHIGIQHDFDWNNESTKAVVDYWQDIHGKDWKVKGYTNGEIMAILYVKNITEVEVARQDLFLDSFILQATA